jgi:hypothetical protein
MEKNYKYPSFKVIGKHKGSFSVLVPATTAQADLAQLVFAFKKARAGNGLSKMLPLSSAKEAFSVLEIYVFTDEIWASPQRLKKFISTNLHQTDEKFQKEYATHVRAHYLYSVAGDQEEGSVGYNNGIENLKNYKRLL